MPGVLNYAPEKRGGKMIILCAYNGYFLGEILDFSDYIPVFSGDSPNHPSVLLFFIKRALEFLERSRDFFKLSLVIYDKLCYYILII